MPKLFFKDKLDGTWKANFEIKKDYFEYQKSFINYLNALDPLFYKAQNKYEFEFICTLIRCQDSKDAGWDPFENLENLYESFKKSVSSGPINNSNAHYAFFLYGLILEASVPYNTIANLLNILDNDRYRVDNFPDSVDVRGRTHTVYPREKIDQIKSRAKKHGITLNLFDEFMDNKLRNAIFHSDYNIYWPEVRINNPTKAYSHTEWMTLINKSFAYMDAFLHLHESYISTYDEPKLIDPHPDTGYPTGAKMTTIVREKYGLLGIRDTWTPEDIQGGRFHNWTGSFLPYEIPLVEKGILKMPPNKMDKVNFWIKYLPPPVKRILVKKFRKLYGIK